MNKQSGRIRVTAIGGIVTAIVVAIWVSALAYGFNVPDSWIGQLVRWPLGVPVVIFGAGLLFVPAEWYFKRRGKPLFVEA